MCGFSKVTLSSFYISKVLEGLDVGYDGELKIDF